MSASARYVAIITDGNGRWAQQRGLPVVEGHRAGADTVKARLRDAAELGIEELTVYSFSTENWNRPPEEVSGLMEMFGERIDAETPELDAEGVRMRFIGRRGCRSSVNISSSKRSRIARTSRRSAAVAPRTRPAPLPGTRGRSRARAPR